MPAPEHNSRHQKAVYWERSGEDHYGNPIIDAGIQLVVRWENKKGEMLDPKNQVIGTDATVHANRELIIGSIMWLGALADLPLDTDDMTGLHQVVANEDAKDIKGRAHRREYGLKRFTKKLPDISED